MTDLVDQNVEKYFFTRINKKTGALESVDMRTGAVVPVTGANGKSLSAEFSSKYTIEISDAICNLLREGKTMTQIVSDHDFLPPVHVIYNWRRLHPDFAQKMDAAIKDRAHYHLDKAMDIAEDAKDSCKDAVPGLKLSADIHLKLLEKSDPDRWGSKVKLSGDKDSPLKIIVDTGIKRAGDDGFDADEIDAIDAEFNLIGDHDEEKEGIEEAEISACDGGCDIEEELREEIRSASTDMESLDKTDREE
jgi:hypothetical protein